MVYPSNFHCDLWHNESCLAFLPPLSIKTTGKQSGSVYLFSYQFKFAESCRQRAHQGVAHGDSLIMNLNSPVVGGRRTKTHELNKKGLAITDSLFLVEILRRGIWNVHNWISLLIPDYINVAKKFMWHFRWPHIFFKILEKVMFS